MRMKSRIVPVLILAGLFLSAVGCSDSLSRAYYARHPMTSEDVAKTWGEPVSVEQLGDGIVRKVYPIQNAATDLDYRYFLIRDDQVVASGVTNQATVGAKSAVQPAAGFVPADLSKAYYQKFPMTVEQLNRIWGQPLHKDKTPEGLERRVYEISDPFTDFQYRYFLIDNGRVVASRISPDKGFKESAAGRQQRSIQINEISQGYYEKHPMNQAELEKIWGQPVFVEQNGDGLVKRIYKIRNPYPSGFEFRYFILKGDRVVSSGITDTVDIAR